MPLGFAAASRRMPSRPAESAPFFEGLLPEGAVRAAIAEKLASQRGRRLRAAGGARARTAPVRLSILPAGSSRSAHGWRPLRPLSEERARRRWSRTCLAIRSASTPSPAGCGSAWAGSSTSWSSSARRSGAVRPAARRDAPSTCLLKPEFGAVRGSRRQRGLLHEGRGRGRARGGRDRGRSSIGGTRCLYVERFDRIADAEGSDRAPPPGGHVPGPRCPARPPSTKKNGGPSVAGIVALLRRLRAPRMRTRRQCLRPRGADQLPARQQRCPRQELRAALRPRDGTSGSRLSTTSSRPLSIRELTTRMAMAIGGVDDPSEVDLASWERLGVESGLGGALPGLVRRWSATVLRRDWRPASAMPRRTAGTTP